MYYSMRGEKKAQIFDDDLLLAGYPRSGSTWLRYLLACVKYSDLGWMDSHIDCVFPDIYNPKEQLDMVTKPRLVKTHEEYHHMRPNKAVYMYRDGRDVMLSLMNWRFVMGNNDKIPKWDFLQLFMAGKIIPGSWRDHIVGWFEGRDADTYYVKYEDLFKYPHEMLKQVCTFYELDWIQNEIDIAIDTFPPGRPWGNLLHHIRPIKAVPGLWKQYFSDEMNELFWDWGKDAMIKGGYIK